MRRTRARTHTHHATHPTQPLCVQGRLVVVAANLKPRNMRGIRSAGMLLATSDNPKTVVELITPPPGAQPGERIWFGDDREQVGGLGLWVRVGGHLCLQVDILVTAFLMRWLLVG